MTNKRSTKGTLLSSIVAMILCFTMFIGSTLAWFTSTASNKGNRIEAGTLKVDLLMDKEENGSYASIADGTGDIFSEATGNGILWEPGKTEIVYLKVENKGSLALKYNIVLTINDEKLAGGLEYAILDEVTAEMVQNAGIDSWKAIEEYTGVQIGDFPTGEAVAAPNGKILAGADGNYFALAVHMKEDADDAYQGKALSFDVKIMATQVPEEEDSFGPDYDEQAVFEGEELVVERQKNVNLLVNSDFETMKSDGANASKWSIYNNVETVYSEGNHYMKLTSTAHVESNAMQTYEGGKVGQKLLLKGLGRLIKSGNEDGYTEIEVMTIAWHENVRTFYPEYFRLDSILTADEWKAFEFEYEVPDNDKTSTADRLQIRVALRAKADTKELHLDNVELLTEETEAVAIARTFREMLAEEEANSVKVEAEFDSDTTVKKDPVPGQTTVVANGDIANGNLDGWTASGEYVTAEADPSEEGNYVIKLSSVMQNETSVGGYQHANQWIPLVGGAEYQVTYRYKVKAGTTGYPTVKFEFYTDRTLAGISCISEKYVSGSNPIRDGEWHEVVNKIYPPANCTEAWVLARLMGSASNSDPNIEMWIDDIEVVMTQAPSAMQLDTDQIFYYTDAQKGIFKASALLTYFPDLENAKVDFQVYDGLSLLWEDKGVTAVEGVATTEFSFRYLMQKEHPYTVKATMYNADGTVACEKTQNIYIYDRPEYLGADGIYMKNGEEPFYPVYAYHVSASHFDEIAAAGINLVQMYGGDDTEYVLEQLDNCEKNGIMGLMTMYPGMKPAGHESNIDTTVACLSDERVINHPALFGYVVMDEVYAGLSNPEYEMEKSYRLIRMLDKKHPITTMEAMQSFYYKCSKFVDILLIDPYGKAQGQNATRGTTNAVAAVKDEKPVYSLLEAYHGHYWPTPQDLRNNIYQALIAGADAVGYYAISDSAKDENGKNTAIWNSPYDEDPDYGLWEGIVEFGTDERDIAYAHFLAEESPIFNQYQGEDYWYYSWEADGGIYMVVLGMKEGQQKAVQIPLTSTDGTVKMEAYTAEIIAGDKGVKGQVGPTSGNGTLDLTIDGVEALLYKITPNDGSEVGGETGGESGEVGGETGGATDGNENLVDLLTNGNLETLNDAGTVATGWTRNGASLAEEEGNHYMKLASTSNAIVSANPSYVTVTPGQTMKLKGKARILSYESSIGTNITLTVIATDSAGNKDYSDTKFSGLNDAFTSEWSTFEYDYTVPTDNEAINNATTLQLKVGLNARGTNVEIHFDDLQLLTEVAEDTN